MSGTEHPPKGPHAGPARFPVATLAFYGPDRQTATKVALRVFLEDKEDPDHLHQWHARVMDVREDPGIAQELSDMLKRLGVKSVAFNDNIIGCPHEEGWDYPAGEPCPHCPYWRNRDRWTGGLKSA